MRLWYPQWIQHPVFVQVIYDNIKCKYKPTNINWWDVQGKNETELLLLETIIHFINAIL